MVIRGIFSIVVYAIPFQVNIWNEVMKLSMRYAGIGSRHTPPEVLALIVDLGKMLALKGYTLRSGAAKGADAAFEQGCDSVLGKKEIWLPWPGFNQYIDQGVGRGIFLPTEAHRQYASTRHPYWSSLRQGPRSLHSRNVGQILGADLKCPVDFVVCWTPDGCESRHTRTPATGGTGMAISIAHEIGIPVINLRNAHARERLSEQITSALDKSVVDRGDYREGELS